MTQAPEERAQAPAGTPAPVGTWVHPTVMGGDFSAGTVPPGGATDDVLTKRSNADMDTEWAPVPPGVPPAGAVGEVLTKQTATDFDAAWAPVPPGVPNGGATAEVLNKVSATDQDVAWAVVPPTPLPPGGATDEVLTKASDTDGDAVWRPSAVGVVTNTAAITMPGPGLDTGPIAVTSTRPFAVGMTVFVEGLGYLDVSAVDAAGSTLTLANTAV